MDDLDRRLAEALRERRRLDVEEIERDNARRRQRLDRSPWTSPQIGDPPGWWQTQPISVPWPYVSCAAGVT